MIHVDNVREIMMADGVDTVLDGSRTIEAPLTVGHVLGELFFRLGNGIEVLDVEFNESEVGLEILIRHDGRSGW